MKRGLGLFSDRLFLFLLQFLVVFTLQWDLVHLLGLIDLRVNANFGLWPNRKLTVG